MYSNSHSLIHPLFVEAYKENVTFVTDPVNFVTLIMCHCLKVKLDYFTAIIVYVV